MKPVRMMLALAAALGLSACATVETATRNAPAEAPTAIAAPGGVPGAAAPVLAQAEHQALSLRGINVRVPRSLKVSEKNSFKPRADIVWREDPLGDRYQQVETLLKDGLAPLVADAGAGRPVVVDLQVTRFHALTQKTRYTVGGTHDIHFFLTVLDADTGQRLADPRHVETELEAYGGAKALEAMSRGETQKIRIQRHMREVLRRELDLPAAPDGTAPLHLSALSSRGI